MEQLELIRFVVSKAGYIQIFNFHKQTFFLICGSQTIFLFRTCIQFISVFTTYTNNLFQNFPTPLSIQKKVMVRPLQTIYNLNEITSFSSVLKGVSMDPSIPPPPPPPTPTKLSLRWRQWVVYHNKTLIINWLSKNVT